MKKIKPPIFLIGLLILILTNLNYISLYAQSEYFITYGGTGNEFLRAFDTTYNNGYIMGGYTTGYGSGGEDIFIVRSDASGNILWAKAIGGTSNDECWGIIQAKDKNFLVTGYTESYGNGQKDAFLLKLDTNGNLLWSKTFGGTAEEYGYRIVEYNGKILLDCKTASYGSGATDPMLISIDQSGTPLWAKTYGFSIHEGFFGAILDGSNFVFTGATLSFGTYDIIFSIIDTSGNFQTLKRYQGAGTEIGADVCKASDNGYVIASYSNSFGSDYEITLIKTDNTGNPDWTKRYGGASTDISYSIYPRANNHYLIAGNTMSYGFGNKDVLIMDCDSLGNLSWAKTYGGINADGGGTSSNIVFGTIKENYNNIIISDYFTSYGSGLGDIGLILCSPSGDVTNCSSYMTINPNTNTANYTVNTHTPNVSNPNGYFNSYSFTNTDVALIRTNVCYCTINLNLNDTSMCPGEIISLDAGAGYSSYLWQGGSTGQNLLINNAGTYYVTVTDTSGCSGNDTINVIFSSTIQNNIGNDTSICYGDTITLNAGSNFDSYEWQDGSTNQTYAVNASGTYWVSVTEAGFCDAVDSITIWVQQWPNNFTLGNDTNLCTGDTLSLNAGGGYSSYLWQDGSTGQNLLINNAGTYYITVTDSIGCPGNDTIEIIFNPTIQNNIGNDTSICYGDTITLNAGSNFDSYEWQDGSTNQTYAVNASGTYWVSVTEAGLCDAVDSITIWVLPEPDNFTLGNDTNLCTGETLTLNAGAGYSSYLWQNGSTNQNFQVTSEGLYYVLATSICGDYSDSIYVGFYYIPIVELGNDTTICENIQFYIDAGDGFQAYLWNTGNSQQNIQANYSGSYSVTITDTNGCSANDEIIISFTDIPEVDLGEDRNLCTTNHVILSVSEYEGTTYQWQDGYNGNTYYVTSGNIYSVTVTNACGFASDTVVISDCPECIIDLPNAFSPNNDGINDILYVLGEGFINLSLLIYNRHGELVFETDNPSIGWDGKYKGVIQEMEVYYYYLSANCLSGEFIIKKGDVTLLN